MQRFSRRDALRMVVAAVGASTLQPILPAFSAPPTKTSVRYNLASAEGERMLAIYARGVAELTDRQKFPDADPRSWVSQWYTHRVRRDRSKASEIQRVFVDGDTRQGIAEKMWDTCQSHLGQREDFFLPWHRMYVLFFEQIIRSVTGEPEFTLPYWDYTGTSHPTVPPQFRMPKDETWAILYRASRNAVANQGKPIDSSPGAAALTLNALRSKSYSDDGSDAGFCANLDGDPHGNLHVDVGNSVGMGDVPWAASDPLFWVHHCNIDRLWASWNRAGGKNPADQAFLGQEFTFANASGAAVAAKVSDFMDMPGYEYDAYVARPPGSPSFKDQTVEPFALRVASRKESGPVALDSKKRTVVLTADAAAGDTSLLHEFSAQLHKLDPAKELYLRLEEVLSAKTFSAAFDVHLSGSASNQLNRSTKSFLGSLSFFGLAEHMIGEAAMPMKGAMGRTFSFVVPREIRAELMEGDLISPNVTFVPRGSVPANAKPKIGRITLVSG